MFTQTRICTQIASNNFLFGKALKVNLRLKLVTTCTCIFSNITALRLMASLYFIFLLQKTLIHLPQRRVFTRADIDSPVKTEISVYYCHTVNVHTYTSLSSKKKQPLALWNLSSFYSIQVTQKCIELLYALFLQCGPQGPLFCMFQIFLCSI